MTGGAKVIGVTPRDRDRAHRPARVVGLPVLAMVSGGAFPRHHPNPDVERSSGRHLGGDGVFAAQFIRADSSSPLLTPSSCSQFSSRA